MRNKINALIALCAFVFIAMACNASFTTAKLDSINFGKNDKANPPATSFSAGDQVFVVAAVSGVSGKYKVRLKVESTSGGDDPYSKDIDMPGSGTVYQSFTPGPGEYKAEATLLDEDGKEVDKKSGKFTVK